MHHPLGVLHTPIAQLQVADELQEHPQVLVAEILNRSRSGNDDRTEPGPPARFEDQALILGRWAQPTVSGTVLPDRQVGADDRSFTVDQVSLSRHFGTPVWGDDYSLPPAAENQAANSPARLIRLSALLLYVVVVVDVALHVEVAEGLIRRGLMRRDIQEGMRRCG
jgi:hypothetical protein